ncbi:MAG: hypothetical protein NBV65_04515 [Burkholderiaceae bacterium]|nr:hypothetical protein [Burkholderiaceae bacterium]
MADDYDSPWKEAIEHFFDDFMAFYFPDAHAQIDWAQPLIFLEQELRAVTRDAEVGKRMVDKLVRVTRRGGSEEWLGLHFPTAKLLDWSGSESRLEDSRNPFAVLTLAHLATQSTCHDPLARHSAKWTLVKRLYQTGFERQQVIRLFTMIDWMMRLPAEYEQRFRNDLMQFEEKIKMRYVNSIERLAREEGLARGRQEGQEQGLEQGRRAGKSQVIGRQMYVRFGALPDWVQTKLDAASEDQLDAWTSKLLTASSIDAVFGSSDH